MCWVCQESLLGQHRAHCLNPCRCAACPLQILCESSVTLVLRESPASSFQVLPHLLLSIGLCVLCRSGLLLCSLFDGFGVPVSFSNPSLITIVISSVQSPVLFSSMKLVCDTATRLLQQIRTHASQALSCPLMSLIPPLPNVLENVFLHHAKALPGTAGWQQLLQRLFLPHNRKGLA